MLFKAVVLFSLLCACPHSSDAFTETDVLEYMDDSISDYKLAIHKAGQQRRPRIRKNVALDDFLEVETETAYESQVYNITPWQIVPTTHPVELEPFLIDGKQYLAVVNFKNLEGKYQTISAVYEMNSTNNKFELLQEFATSGGIDFEYADLETEKYAIFLDHVGQNWYGGHTYQKWFQLQQFLPHNDHEKPFAYKTKVRALGAKRVKAFRKNGRSYFVTANSYYEVGDKYHVKSTMHVQSPFGYELVQSFDTQGAQDVEVILIGKVRYILFVNHQDNSGKVDIFSVVYRESTYQEFTQSKLPFILYQRIGTHGGRDFEYFTFENNHYLAVANEYTQITVFDSQVGRYVTIKNYNLDSVIYWWTGTMWVEWQKIPTEGAVKWSFFTSTYGDPMLVVANSKSQAIIFTYDPLRGFFKPTEVQGLSPFPENRDTIPDVRSVMSFSVGSRHYLAVANYNETMRSGYNIFEITFTRKVVPKLDPSVPEIVLSLLAKMKIQLEEVKKTLSKVLLEVKHRVMTKSTDQNITVNMSFKNMTVRDTLTTNNTYYRDNITVNPIELSAKEAFVLKGLLQKQEQKLVEFQTKLDDAVGLNDTTTVTGTKTFLREVDLAKNLIVVNTTRVGGLIDSTNLTDLQNRAWSKTQDQILTGTFQFDKDVSIRKNATIMGKLNGKRMDSLMTVNTDQTITSKKEFQDDLTIDNNTTLSNFHLNSYNVPDDFVTNVGNQTITGYKTFNDIILTDVTVNGLVDDVNITVLHDERMTLTTSQTIDSITFNSDVTVLSNTDVGGLVDGVNITSFYYDVLHGGGTQVISGPRTFQSTHIMASLNSSLINEFNLDDAVTTDTEQILLADFKFENDVIVNGDVITNSTIDNIDLSEHAVIKHGNQTIDGLKTFTNDVIFGADILVNQLVDGVDLRGWNATAVTYTSSIIGGYKSFLHPIIQGNLSADFVNDITLSTLEDGLISLDSDGYLNHYFTFQDVVVQKDLIISGKLNGYHIPNDLVTLDTSQNISGTKTFLNKTTITGTLEFSANLNGENFTQFYEDAVRNDTNQTRLSTTFMDDVTFNKVVVDGTVNGLSIPDDIVTINTAQNVYAEKRFYQDTVFQGIVDTFIIHVNETVDNIDVFEMEQNAVYKNRNQTINGSIIFVGGIDCKQNISVAGLINGINLTELVNSTVRISRDQSIFGLKEFLHDVQFHNTITSPGLINDVNLQELNATVMKRSGDQHIFSNVLFKSNVTIVNLKTSNISEISQIHFHEFLKKVFRNTGNNTINGNLTYVNLQTNTLASEVVDGINVSNILLVHGNQNVQGKINFSSVIAENVTVIQLISGVDITELNEMAVKLGTHQNLTGTYTFQNLTVKGNVYIEGYLNNVNLTEYSNSAVYLATNDTISGLKTFVNVSFDNVIFKGLLNGVNMSLIVDDSLKRTGDQSVCIKKTFVSPLVINSTLINDITLHGLLNNMNVTNLFQNSVMLNDSQILLGNYNFRDGLHINENLTVTKLNDIDITKDLVLTSSDQNITGTKSFHDVHIQKHLSVSGTIDGVDVRKLDNMRVTLSTNQTVSGIKEFETVLVRDVIFPGNATINGIDISEDLIKTDEDSVISGEKYFQNVTVTHGINTTTGIVNKVDLPEFNKNALKTESEKVQILSSNQRFLRNLTIHGDLTVLGFINGIKVSPTNNYSSDVSDTIKERLLSSTRAAQVLCNSTTELLTLSNYGTSFGGIKKISSKMFPAFELGSIDTFVVNEMVFLSIARPYGAVCGDAYVLKCTADMTCYTLQTFQTNAYVLEFMEYNNFTALTIFHEDTNTTTSCKQTPEIFVFSVFTQKFEPYQTLNEELLMSENAPLMKNKNVLKKQFNRKSKNQPNNNNKKTKGVEFFQDNQKHFVAVAGTNNFDSDYVDIYEVNGANVNDLKKKQRIKVGKGRKVAFGKSGKSGKSKLVLAVSSPERGAKLKLYRKDKITGQFKFYQKIDDGASSIIFQDVGQKSYLSYTNPSNGIGLCPWQGTSGYNDCHSLQFTDTDNVNWVVTSAGSFPLAVTENELLIFKFLYDGNTENYSNSTC